jgi:6-phosphogluconate dehydrogenase (decarboxylating)
MGIDFGTFRLAPPNWETEVFHAPRAKVYRQGVPVGNWLFHAVFQAFSAYPSRMNLCRFSNSVAKNGGGRITRWTQ